MIKIKYLMMTLAIFITFMCFGITTVQADTQSITNTEDMLRIVFQNWRQPEDSPNASLVDGVITLNNDYDTDNCGYLIGGNYKIDLNGHTIRYNQASGSPFFSIGPNSSIEIGDSKSTPGGISITGNLRALYLFSVNGGRLIINNGNYTNTAHNWYYGVGNIEINSGTVIINGGTFTTSFDHNVQISSGDLTINDGNFLGAEKSIVAQGSNNSINSVTINKGTFTTREDSITNLAFQFNQLEGIRINGGKFTGNEYGLLYYDEDRNTTVTAEDVSAILGANSKIVGGFEFNKIYDTNNRLKGFITGKTSEVEQKKKYNIVMTANVTGGTISVDDLKPFEGSSVSINVQPISGYRLKEIKILKYLDDTDVTSSLGYNSTNNSFTMPNYNVKVIPEFELIPSEKMITKTEDDMTVSVKGMFSGNPEFVITQIEKGNEGYDALIKLLQKDKQVIGSYDISITGANHIGELSLTFAVGRQYEGKTITIYHKLANGEIETKTAIIEDGKATITVNELSPFMLVANKTIDNKDETPKTGVEMYCYLYTIIISITIVGIYTTNKLMINNKK